MESRVTLQTRCTCTVCRFAQFADRVVPKCRRPYALHHVEASCTAELDLRMPERAVYVDPVIVGSTFKRFTGNKGSAFLLLSKAVFFFGLVDKLFLQSFLLPIAISLLLVCDLWLLIKVLFGIFLRTKNTFVVLLYVRIRSVDLAIRLTYDTLSFLSFLQGSQYHLLACRDSSTP